MNWKYFIGSEWVSERATWEDVHLLPDDPDYDGEALWLTVEALGCAYDESTLSKMHELLSGREFYCHETDMIVASEDFSMGELLDWVKKWFSDNGIQAEGFIQGTFEEFRNKNNELRVLDALRTKNGEVGGSSV